MFIYFPQDPIENLFIFRWVLLKTICGSNQHRNHQQQQRIRLLPLVAHQYVITCSISSDHLLFTHGQIFLSSSLSFAHIDIFFFFSLRFFPYLRAWITQAQSTLYFLFLLPFSSLSMQRLRLIYLHSPTFSSAVNNFVAVFFQTISADEKKKSIRNSSILLWLFGVHMCFSKQQNRHISTERDSNQIQNTTSSRFCAHTNALTSVVVMSFLQCVCAGAHSWLAFSLFFLCPSLVCFLQWRESVIWLHLFH